MSAREDSAPGRRPTAGDLTRLGGPPGLCATCRHAALLTARTSAFLRCGLAERDPAFSRYPRLPVVVCAGYEQVPEDGLPA